MGLTKHTTTGMCEIILNEGNGSSKPHDKDYTLLKNGSIVFHDGNGREFNERFETLFMANDRSHAIVTSIGGNRYSLLLE